MLSHNEAIDLEVAMLTKSAIRYNNDDIPSGYTSKISLAALKKKYAMHQKMRLLSKKRSYVVVCDSQKDIIESDSVNKVMMQCQECGNHTAELQISWAKIANNLLDVPCYNLCCNKCGAIQGLDYFDKMMDNA